MSNAAAAARAESAAPGVQSVDRAISILELLARHGEVGVTEVAGEIGVHKSTAFRLVATLEQRGLVEQTADRGKYRLGVGLLRLAGATTARLDVVQEARPVGKALAAATGETVNVAVLSGHSALYLDQMAGTSALQPHNWVGQHIPLHATSNGKVLLSGLTAERLDEVLDELRPLTRMTVTTRSVLESELAKVREEGYAVAVDELEEGLTAAAAPIRNAHSDVIASLSVSGPTFRLDEAALHDVIPALVGAAEEVSHRLGWGER